MNETFEVRVRKEVIKEAKKLSKTHRRRLADFIKILESNPIPLEFFDVKPIKGKKGKKKYRLRLGNYRIFYEIFWKEKIIIVLKIEPRKRAYSRK